MYKKAFFFLSHFGRIYLQSFPNNRPWYKKIIFKKIKDGHQEFFHAYFRTIEKVEERISKKVVTKKSEEKIGFLSCITVFGL